MRFSFYEAEGKAAVAVLNGTTWHRLDQLDLTFPTGIEAVATFSSANLAAIGNRLASNPGPALNLEETRLLPPIGPNARIFCVGLNYADHADESKMEKPAFPVVFLRTYDSF